MNDTQRPTWCDINLTALENNYKAIQAHVGDTQVMPIIKADAYGHGITQVASKLEELNTPCLGVAYVEEGVTLRKAGITTPIHTWRSRRETDTNISRTQSDLHCPVSRQTLANKRSRRSREHQSNRSPQNRHRHGTYRRPPLQR